MLETGDMNILMPATIFLGLLDIFAFVSGFIIRRNNAAAWRFIIGFTLINLALLVVVVGYLMAADNAWNAANLRPYYATLTPVPLLMKLNIGIAVVSLILAFWGSFKHVSVDEIRPVR